MVPMVPIKAGLFWLRPGVSAILILSLTLTYTHYLIVLNENPQSLDPEPQGRWGGVLTTWDNAVCNPDLYSNGYWLPLSSQMRTERPKLRALFKWCSLLVP